MPGEVRQRELRSGSKLQGVRFPQSSGPRPSWHWGPVSWKMSFPQTGVGVSAGFRMMQEHHTQAHPLPCGPGPDRPGPVPAGPPPAGRLGTPAEGPSTISGPRLLLAGKNVNLGTPDLTMCLKNLKWGCFITPLFQCWQLEENPARCGERSGGKAGIQAPRLSGISAGRAGDFRC